MWSDVATEPLWRACNTTDTKHAGFCKDFGLTYTNIVRLENVRLVKIRNLMSPSPEVALDCQLHYLWSGNRLANRTFLRCTLQNVISLLVSSLTNEETNTLSEWPESQRDGRLH